MEKMIQAFIFVKWSSSYKMCFCLQTREICVQEKKTVIKTVNSIWKRWCKPLYLSNGAPLTKCAFVYKQEKYVFRSFICLSIPCTYLVHKHYYLVRYKLYCSVSDQTDSV